MSTILYFDFNCECKIIKNPVRKAKTIKIHYLLFMATETQKHSLSAYSRRVTAISLFNRYLDGYNLKLKT